MNNPVKLTEDIFVVVVPKDATQIQVWSHGVGFKTKLLDREPDDTNGFYHTATGLGRWRGFELLGEATADSISFDVEPYVEQPYLKKYTDYLHKWLLFSNSKESFYSLLQSEEIYLVNPISEPELIITEEYQGYDDNWVSAWQEAESKLVEKVIILNRK